MNQKSTKYALLYPAGLLVLYLLAQLLLLAWSAFPAYTMRGQQPRQSWAFLVGLQALFVSWSWPMLRSYGNGLRQAAVEAALLVAASVPAAVPAIAWVDPSWSQIAAPISYVLAWLLASTLAIISRPLVRWSFCLLATFANFGLLGLGYLWRDMLSADAWPMWRLSPTVYSADLAAAGWPGELAGQLAMIVPVVLLLLLLAGRLLDRPASDH